MHVCFGQFYSVENFFVFKIIFRLNCSSLTLGTRIRCLQLIGKLWLIWKIEKHFTIIIMKREHESDIQLTGVRCQWFPDVDSNDHASLLDSRTIHGLNGNRRGDNWYALNRQSSASPEHQQKFFRILSVWKWHCWGSTSRVKCNPIYPRRWNKICYSRSVRPIIMRMVNFAVVLNNLN